MSSPHPPPPGMLIRQEQHRNRQRVSGDEDAEVLGHRADSAKALLAEGPSLTTRQVSQRKPGLSVGP